MSYSHSSWKALLTALIYVLLTAVQQPAHACTGITLTAEDGAVVYARTLEFGIDLDSEILVVPRGFARTGTTPDGKEGLKWTSKYASTGANGAGLPILVDGLNEKGLAVGLFYFPGTAVYPPYNAANAGKTIAPWELGSWILENFSTTAEVRDNIEKVLVPSVVLKAWGFAPPIHYIVTDATGKSIVIEYVGGKLNVHDNPIGVMTNSPTFDWHMTNLRNYVNLSYMAAPPVQLGPIKLVSFGQGSGMLGLPGDFTPPSRFVRAAAFSHGTGAFPSKTGDDAVLQAFHILNNFDIPKGSAREKDEHGNVLADHTLWTSANDLKAKCYYIRTYENSQIRSLDLTKTNQDARNITKISLEGKEVIRPLIP